MPGLLTSFSKVPSADSKLSIDVNDGSGWTRLGSTSDVKFTTTLSSGTYQFRVRATNSSGTGQWSYSLPIGVSSSHVRPLPLDGQVARLYQAYFSRNANADPDGFSYWLTRRAEGASAVAISDAFAGSAEFVQTYGTLSNAQFVDLVYRNVLGRPADAEGRSYWIGELDRGMARGQVMLGFSDSPEFVNLTGTAAPTSSNEGIVSRLYFAFFLRYPDAAGLQYWVGQLSSSGLVPVAESFTVQPEFVQTYGSLSNDQFVDLVYRNVLAREADNEGRSYWLSRLASGMSRGEMMTGFSESTEFILRTGTMAS